MPERKLSILVPEIVLGVIGVLAVVGLGIVLNFGVSGVPLADVWSGYGTVALVLVTLVNVSLSGIALLESRKERQISRDVLKENQRDRVVEYVNEILIGTKNQLRLEQRDIKMGDGVLNDFENFFFNSAKEFEQIDKSIYNPLTGYSQLKREIPGLQDHLINQLSELPVDQWPDDAQERVRNSLPEDRDVEDISIPLEAIARFVVYHNINELPSDWVEQTDDRVIVSLSKVKKSELFRGDFDALSGKIASLDKIVENIIGIIDSKQDELVREYDIYPTELDNEKTYPVKK